MLYRHSRLADCIHIPHYVGVRAGIPNSIVQPNSSSFIIHTLGHQNVPLCIRLFNVSVAVHVPVIRPTSLHWLQFTSQMRASHPLADCQIITTISCHWVVNPGTGTVYRSTPSPSHQQRQWHWLYCTVRQFPMSVEMCIGLQLLCDDKVICATLFKYAFS